jgi:hypothetical protein
MIRDLVNYEGALELNGLGFNEPCFCIYNRERKLRFNNLHNPPDRDKGVKLTSNNGRYPAPTLSQAFRWFREEHGLKHDIDDDKIGKKFYYKIRSYTDKFDNYDDIIKPMREERDWSKIEFSTYEGAELACLKKLIEIVKSGALDGKRFEIDITDNLCYCGKPVDTTNPDCIDYALCKEHAMDV